MNYQTAISFGLVNIPVYMNGVIKNNDISFNYIHKKCKERVKYIKYCPKCKKEVKNTELEKGYEYEKSKYVIFTEEDFENVKNENDKTIEIISFVNLNEIDPIYFEKSYTLMPNKSTKSFTLFKEALKKSKKCAIARTYLRNKAYYVIIRFGYENIILNTLYYEEEIKIKNEKSKSDVNTKELNMALKLIDSMSDKFKPEEYVDEYQNNLKNAVNKKINGKKITSTKRKNNKTINDLMAALEESLKDANDKK